jgi:hypothetical protein
MGHIRTTNHMLKLKSYEFTMTSWTPLAPGFFKFQEVCKDVVDIRDVEILEGLTAVLYNCIQTSRRKNGHATLHVRAMCQKVTVFLSMIMKCKEILHSIIVNKNMLLRP